MSDIQAVRYHDGERVVGALHVEWSPVNQQWMIVGGYLPFGTAWAAFDSRDDAVAEAMRIAEDIQVEFQQ